MTGNTDPDLIAEAARRFLRLREDGDDTARLTLRQWMEMDVRHAAAIDLVERGWRNAGVLAPAASGRIPPRRSNPRRRPARERLVSPRRLGWAAGLAVAIALLVGAEYDGNGFGWPHDYATRDTAQDITLADGSRLRLQPHSRATARLSLFSRDIALHTGGGAFIVAHEQRRPFVVRADTIGIEATGTRFSVATNAAGTRVALWQGGVRLRDRTSDAVLAYLKPGDHADIASSGRIVLTPPQPAKSASPRVFVFDDTPLADAVARIAAGTGLRVRFVRPGLARLPVSSVYHGDDLPAFLDDLGAIEPICWRKRGTTVEIMDGSAACAGKKALP